jgi:hypothetical protein
VIIIIYLFIYLNDQMLRIFGVTVGSITIHEKSIVLIGTWSNHPEKHCYHKGGMGRSWLIN